MPKARSQEITAFEPDREYDVILKRRTPFLDDYLPASRTIRMLGTAAQELSEAILESQLADTPNVETTPLDDPDKVVPPRG